MRFMVVDTSMLFFLQLSAFFLFISREVRDEQRNEAPESFMGLFTGVP